MTARWERLAFLRSWSNPAWRRRGLAGALLRELLALDDDRETEFHTLVRPDWTAGLAFLAAFGFEVVEEEIAMKLDAPPTTAYRVDQDILFERIEDIPAVADAIARVHNAAYASDAGFRAHDEMAMLLRDADVWVAREHREYRRLLHGGARSGECLGREFSRSIQRDRDGASGPSCLDTSSLRKGWDLIGLHRYKYQAFKEVARRAYVRLGFVETSRQIRFAARRHEMNARMR